MQGWSLTSLCEEYRRYAEPKPRALDQQFIELFDLAAVQYRPRHQPAWMV